MILLKLRGGIGNQMFQYALGRVLAIKNNTELILDTEAYTGLSTALFKKNSPVRSFNLGMFNIAGRIADRSEIPFLRRMYGRGKVRLFIGAIIKRIFSHKGQELSFKKFDPSLLTLGPNAYLDGFFQSPHYFAGYEDVIKNDFTLQYPSGKVTQLITEIKSLNSVCIHVRRGDYVGHDLHPVVDMSYYENALKIISNKKTIDRLYVFDRDDIEWCKIHMKFDYPTIYVENDIHVAETLVAMSNCKHIIMANSSFSWWAAWLCDNDDKIIVCPKQWFARASMDTFDLIPKDWLRI